VPKLKVLNKLTWSKGRDRLALDEGQDMPAHAEDRHDAAQDKGQNMLTKTKL